VSHSSRRTETPYPTVTFQAVFFEGSPDVLFNYQDVDFRDGTDSYDRGLSATVGVQVATAPPPVQLQHQEPGQRPVAALENQRPAVLGDLSAAPASTDEAAASS